MTTYNLEMRDNQCGHTISIAATSVEDAVAQAAEETESWIEGGEWGDAGASVSARWTLTDEDGAEVVHGFVEVDIPANENALIPKTECGDRVDDHDWTSEGCGGVLENPGVWNTGGTSMLFKTRCTACGIERLEETTGSQRNPGEHDTVKFELPSD